MLIRIMRLIRGCVYLLITGDSPERMLTLLSRSGLPFWHIRRRSHGICICMYAAHIKKLRPITRGTHNRIHILGRRGVPFILRRYRHRIGLALGLTLFLFGNWTASAFIWNINVEGNLSIPTHTILQYLEDVGVAEGTFSKNIDCDNIRVNMAKDIEGVSWASLTIEGSRLTVSIHERQIVDTSPKDPCNLIAARDGVIDTIRALNGKTMIKKGQTVQKGQLLVSGVLEYTTGATDFVASQGEIFAFTTHELTTRQPLTYTQTRRTGLKTQRSVFTFFGFNIPLYLGRVTQPYQKDVELYRWEANGAYLPFHITTATFHFTQNQIIQLTEERAGEMALQQMNQLCDQQEYEILSYTDEYRLENGEIVLTRHIQARENIAQSEKIEIDDAKSN